MARLYGYTVQQVSNWCVRGIPPKEIVGNEAFANALSEIRPKAFCTPTEPQHKEAA